MAPSPIPSIQRTQEVALRQTRELTHASWFYPFKGIYYFLAHPFLWPLLHARLLPCILLSAFVLTTLFIWTYIPQWAFLALFHGIHGAWLNATFLVLGEGAAITALLFEAFLVDEGQVDIFDAVLVYEGFESLVSATRPVDPLPVENPLLRLQKPTHASVYAPFSLRQIVEFVCLLPLNFVPWIGVPLFLWLTGWRAGPLHHYRYFKLKEFTKEERKAFVKKRSLRYTAFGTVSLMLQLVPVASMIFLLTTSAGSALWAADLERQGQEQEQGQGQQQGHAHSQSTVPDSPPPEYSDYIDDPV